ncbi:MAG: cell wall hydrolase [Eubacteriales bacterium]|nr:cell wall hydrolase [Eubacteriales bacterium]
MRKRRRRVRLYRQMIALGIMCFILIGVIVGSSTMRKESHGRVLASEEGRTGKITYMAQLPSGIAGVVSSVFETPQPGSKVNRIGTSCENMMVGQRISTVENTAVQMNISSSVENTVNHLETKSMSMANSPKMMSDDDYYWLLRIVEAEAGEGDVKSRVLVANVIMNRVAREDFPNTIMEVVFQNVNGVPQFSPTYDGSIYRVTVTEETKEAVKQALNGVDYSQGALFFIQKEAAEAHGISWFEKDLKRLFKYGVHEYYTYPETVDMKSEA